MCLTLSQRKGQGIDHREIVPTRNRPSTLEPAAAGVSLTVFSVAFLGLLGPAFM